jgi:hypothetical protein
MARLRDRLGGPWKEALEHFLPECLALLVPDIHVAIDWSRGVTFFDSGLDGTVPEAALEAELNPFATVVLARLAAKRTREDAQRRLHSKLAIVRRLMALGYGRDEVVRLMRLIGWQLRLPKEPETGFRSSVRAIDEDGRMGCVTSIERLAREEGRKEGRQEGLQHARLAIARTRIGSEREPVCAAIASSDNSALPSEMVDLLVRHATLEEVRHALAATGRTTSGSRERRKGWALLDLDGSGGGFNETCPPRPGSCEEARP